MAALLSVLLLMLLPLRGQEIEGGGIESPPLGGFTHAEKLYNELSYHEAIPVYEHYLEKHDSGLAMLQLGDCYRLTSNFAKAQYWYGKGLEKGGEVDAKYKLYYAQTLQTGEQYTEAAKWYASYKQSVPEDKRANNQLKSSADYTQFLVTKNRYEVHNLSFNSTGYDFAPSWNGEGLIYSSSRDSAKAISRQSTWTGTQFFDMYYVEGEGTGFGKPKAMEGDAATKYHEANASFTPDSTKVYFTRNNYYNGKTGTSSVGKIIKLDIYSSDVDGLKWTNDQEFAYNNDEYSVGHPSLSADGETLYFVSDMPGGYGATDLYVTKKDGEKWGTPQNLGPEFNTEGNEMFPYVDKEGTLYFASDGHGGLGGLDNFKVKQTAQKSWGKIKNIGAPINSSYDDFGMIYGKDKSLGYFTSNRPGGKGSDDIYSFEDHGVDLEGIVVDAKTGKPICKSSVTMNTKTTDKKDGPKQTECDGYFEFSVVTNTDYCFEAGADGYLSNNTVCATTKGVKPGETVKVKIPLQKDDPTSLTVLVIDKATKSPIASAKVALSNSCNDSIQNSETDAAGTTCHMVKCGCGFIASANATGYLPGSGEGSTRKDNCPQVKCSEGGGDTIIIELEKIIIVAVELKDIYYDFDKWNIRPESEPQLNILLGFLKENADAVVEIASHTDARAPYDYNIRLSQKRAQSVVDWLVSHGIERSRVKPKGYGETKLRNSCSDDVKCSEYEHQRNRRTEFQVIGGDIDIKSLERFDMQVDPCKVCPF
jgi:outer membrane protein OmpA-like peptidoglycan-associated protein